MLNTDNRQLLLNSLRPPLGYHFDQGIGTTFSLDLLSLMVAPLALALVDFDGIESALRDPLVLMESLRRVAGRLTIFCQGGRIAVPAKQNLLFHYLEDRVIEVNKKGGVFHPKIWLLRYISAGVPPLYRLLVLSRNLTFDRSWDLMLQLEGEVDEKRTIGLRANDPLARFLAELPNLAMHELATGIQEGLTHLEREVRRVRWKTPEPFEGEPVFLPIGIPRHRALPLEMDYQRLMIISPFLQDSILQRWTERGSDHRLISRVDSLDRLQPETLARFKNIEFLEDPIEDVPEEGVDSVNEEMSLTRSNETDLSGLHAKLVVWENGWDAGWIIGSANATENGFGGRNIEFMVGLQGKRSKVGVDVIHGLSGAKTDFPFSALLKPYSRDERVEPDPAQEQAEKLAETVQDWLVNAHLQLMIQPSVTGYDLCLNALFIEKQPKGDVTVNCWPINLPDSAMLPLPVDQLTGQVVFCSLSLLALTRFMAFQINVHVGKAQASIRFVLNVPVIGMPAGRDERVISEIIANPEQFLRYIRLLLGNDPTDSEGDGLAGTNLNEIILPGRANGYGDDLALLENILRAASRTPDRIDRIAEIVTDLNQTPEGQQALPPEFSRLWQTIEAWRAEFGQTKETIHEQ